MSEPCQANGLITNQVEYMPDEHLGIEHVGTLTGIHFEYAPQWTEIVDYLERVANHTAGENA